MRCTEFCALVLEYSCPFQLYSFKRERERESPVKLFSLYVWREREGALREFREMLESCPFNLWRERERERERVGAGRCRTGEKRPNILVSCICM